MSARPPRIAFVAVDTAWEDPAGEYAPFSYASRKLEAAVRSMPEAQGVETFIVDLKTSDPDAFLAAIDAIEPTIVAATAYVWSVRTFLELARRLKEHDPSIIFVMGGPAARPSLLNLAPYRPLLRYVDAVVTGEGEQIVRDLARARDWSSVPGMLRPNPLGFRSTGEAGRPTLDDYPSPYQIGTAPVGRTGYIETFRGCPISCAFCQWGEQKSDRTHGVDYLASHLRGLIAADVPNVFFLDAAFNLSGRAFRNLMEADRQVGALKSLSVHGHLYPTHVKEEHLRFLEIVGRAQVSVGIQSFDADVLKRLGRPFDMDRFEAVLRELQGRIPIDLELMIGLPGDNPASYRSTVERSLELGDTLRIFFPLILPDALLERADEFSIEFDPQTFMLEQCAGWTREDLRREWEWTARRLEGLPNLFVRDTWMGSETRALGPAPRATELRGLSLEAVAPLREAIAAELTGWTLSGVRRERDALLIDLASARGSVVLSVAPKRAGERSFAERGGFAYSHRGPVDRAVASELPHVIDTLHERAKQLLVPAS